MSKGKGDSKIRGVKSTKQTRNVEETRGVTSSSGVRGTEGVTGVSGIKGATSVGGVGGVGRVRATRTAGVTITAKQKEKLFAVIREEADKLSNDGIIPKTKKKIIESAVMMALEAALVDDDGESPAWPGNPRGDKSSK